MVRWKAPAFRGLNVKRTGRLDIGGTTPEAGQKVISGQLLMTSIRKALETPIRDSRLRRMVMVWPTWASPIISFGGNWSARSAFMQGVASTVSRSMDPKKNIFMSVV